MLVAMLMLSLVGCDGKDTNSNNGEEVSSKEVSGDDFIGEWVCETTFKQDFAGYKVGDKQVLTIKIIKGGTASQEVADASGKVLSNGSAEWEYVGDNIMNVTSAGTANGYELQSDGTLKRLIDDLIYEKK